MILDKFKLDGKVAIVTGAAVGLGQGMAVALAQAGANIVGVSEQGNLAETKAAVEAAGAKFVGVVANLMTIAPVQMIVDSAVAAFGRVDILVNNAGIIRREDSINFTEKDWDDVTNINLKTVFFMSQAVAKQYIAQKSGGKIINIASMLAFQGGIRVPSYSASKSGVKGITMSMATEWAKHGINSNAIAPGYMETNNTALIRADENRRDAITDRIPAGRWGVPGDLMGTVVFLASPASEYVNGFTIAVDGGWLAR